MVDSTLLPAPPKERVRYFVKDLRRLPGRLDPCPRGALRTVVHCVEEEIPAAIEDLLACGSPPAQRSRGEAALAAIAEEAGRLTVVTGKKGRIVRKTELGRFRSLGAECAAAGIVADDMVTTLDAAGDAILDTMIGCARNCDGLYSEHQIDQTIEAMSGCIETLTRYAYDELVAGTSRSATRKCRRRRRKFTATSGHGNPATSGQQIANVAPSSGVASRSDGRGRHLARAVRPCGRASGKVNALPGSTAARRRSPSARP